METDNNTLLLKAVGKDDIGTLMTLVECAGELDLKWVNMAQEIAQKKNNIVVIELLGEAEKKIKQLKQTSSTPRYAPPTRMYPEQHDPSPGAPPSPHPGHYSSVSHGEQRVDELLYEAVADGKMRPMKSALSNGANPNKPCPHEKDGSYPIHIVADKGIVNLMKELKNWNSYLDVKDYHGNTPLHRAAFAGKEGAASWLLRQGINCTGNNKGKSASEVAESQGHPELGKFLKECEDSPDSKAAAESRSRKKVMEDKEEIQTQYSEYKSCKREVDNATKIRKQNEKLEMDNAAGEKNYYEILGVSKGADQNEITTAFKKKARLHHTDKIGHLTEEEQRDHKIKFQKIEEAKRILSDPEKRCMFDNGFLPH